MSKNQQPVDWLTPKEYNKHGEDNEENKIGHVLLSLRKSLEKKIAHSEQTKAHADDKGKFGKYRYLSGFIDGLGYSINVIDNLLEDVKV
jgi:hypothetical protein